jgi:4-amino-4-deoxy-L-arabinose transferase-like glycosyltransferase
VLVVAVAAAVRLLGFLSTPLIVTWDGMEYIHAARSLIEEGKQTLTPYRTPGYPIMLSGAFWICGPNPVVILALQHAFGVVMCWATAWASVHLAGPAWGLALGLAMAIEPTLLVFESHALTEAPSTALAVICTAVTLADRRPRPGSGLLLGALLGVGCLIRPALQVLVPFYVVAWALRAGSGPRRRLVLLACAAGGLAVTTGPWLIYNASRGVTGLARGSAIAAWYGVARSGLVIEPPAYVDEATAAAFHKHVRATEPNPENKVWPFLREIKAVRDKGAYELLRRWHRDSVANNPGKYARAVLHGVLWQVNVFIPWGPYQASDNAWFMSRFRIDARTLGQAAPNFNASGTVSRYEAFGMYHTTGGWLHRFYGWYSVHSIRGVPPAALMLAAVGGLVVGIWKRQWPLALVCAGTLAFVGVHALMLLAQPRYGNPAWATWYIVVAGLAGMCGPFRRSGSPA